MTYTSAQANKLLKKLHDEHAALLDRENRSKDFRAAMGEDVESVRPAYDYGDTQNRLAELEQRIRKVKHAINVFNATHVIPGFDMTIDEMLVYIPQLTQRKNKLADMKARLPKERVEEQYGRQSNIIDYTYANYDLAAVEADIQGVSVAFNRHIIRGCRAVKVRASGFSAFESVNAPLAADVSGSGLTLRRLPPPPSRPFSMAPAGLAGAAERERSTVKKEGNRILCRTETPFPATTLSSIFCISRWCWCSPWC